ncbi:MAG: hypothetical protein J5659_06690 [Clostridia bacterium]|nr:hypothetical protein [Clostridia bacterium]
MNLGKTLILGDSYSTFEGNIPDGYDSWYFKAPSDHTNVNKAEQTWWYQLFDGKNGILLRNDSYSGTMICNSVRPEHSVEVSFINRFDKLVKEGFFQKNQVDTILVFGGTNDSTTDCPIGENQFGEFKAEDLLKVLPACGYLARQISIAAPDSRICWLINTDLKDEISYGMIKNAEYFNQDYILFKSIDKSWGHPNINGMQDILNEIKEHFDIAKHC